MTTSSAEARDILIDFSVTFSSTGYVTNTLYGGSPANSHLWAYMIVSLYWVVRLSVIQQWFVSLGPVDCHLYSSRQYLGSCPFTFR